MQQTMEILSLAPTRADPGLSNRQPSRARQDDTGFNRAFEQELGRSESRQANSGRSRARTFESTESTPRNQNLTEDDEDLVAAAAQAAGVW